MLKRAIILTDGKAGHENQSRAFARALGLDAEIAPVAFKSPKAKALSYLLDRLGVATLSLFDFPKGTPGGAAAAVIGTGSGVFYAAKALARRLRAKCGVVLYPRGYRLGGFDCVLAPAFDRPAPAPNVVEIPANLVAADAAFYAAGEESFRAHYARVNARPLAAKPEAVAVVVGGPNKRSTLEAAWTKARLEEIFAAPENAGRAFWTTTSRRTPPEVEKVVDSFPWDYKLLYSRDRFNPIPGFVALARTLYVTAESTGMVSEACTSGAAEVRVLDNLAPGPHKFRRFIEDLRAAGHVDGARKIDLSQQFIKAKELLCL